MMCLVSHTTSETYDGLRSIVEYIRRVGDIVHGESRVFGGAIRVIVLHMNNRPEMLIDQGNTSESIYERGERRNLQQPNQHIGKKLNLGHNNQPLEN